MDSLLLLFILSSHRESRALTYDYLKQHYARVVAALPSETLFAYLPKIAEGFDTPERQRDVESFFQIRTRGLPVARASWPRSSSPSISTTLSGGARVQPREFPEGTMMSGHYIQKDEPAVVIDAVRQVVESARDISLRTPDPALWNPGRRETR